MPMRPRALAHFLTPTLTPVFALCAQTKIASACRPADESSGWLLRWARHTATGTTDYHAGMRTRLKLPKVDSPQVRYVEEDALVGEYWNRTIQRGV
jgi:hypothetical protein